MRDFDRDKNGRVINEGDKLYFPTYKAYGIVTYKGGELWVNLVNRPPNKRQEGSLFDFMTSVGWCDNVEIVKGE